MSSETTLGQYIPLHYHYQMLLDEARMRGFQEAIEYAVPTGGRVLELGGGTGVLSCFAGRRAEKVWCVERQPELARSARRFLAMNSGGENVEVINADAGDFLPPEPVDVVICEMLHSALLREKQIEIIGDFKKRYLEKFETLPRFLPEATILAVEPVHQEYEFFGYRAQIPIFEDPIHPFESTQSLGDAVDYAIIDYSGPLPEKLSISGQVPATKSGTCNALRFRTNNVLAVVPEKNGIIGWMNQHLVLPLEREIQVQENGMINIEFEYHLGDEINSLAAGLLAY